MPTHTVCSLLAQASSGIVPVPPAYASTLTPAYDIGVEQHRQPPYETSEHSLAHHVLTIQLDAPIGVVGRVAGQPYQHRAVSGDCALVPAHVPTQERWDGMAEYVAIRMAPTTFHQIIEREHNGHTIHLQPQMQRQDSLLVQLGLTLLAEMQTKDPANDIYRESVVVLLALHLARHGSGALPPLPSPVRGLPPTVLQRVMTYINDRLAEPLSLTTLAAVAHLRSWNSRHSDAFPR